MSTEVRDDDALRDLAQAMGILPRWCGFAGVEQATGVAFEVGAMP